MVSDMRNFLYIGRSGRLASIAVMTASFLCSVPQSGICLSSDESDHRDPLDEITDEHEDFLVAKFDQLEEKIQSSTDSLEEGRKFLHTFVQELNIQYGLNLTMQEACLLVRDNLHTLHIPPEIHNIILETITLMESTPKVVNESKPHFEQISHWDACSLRIRLPWFKGIFGSTKTKKHRKHHKTNQHITASFASASPINALGTDKELPGCVYVGGTEILAGALVCILGTVFPPAYGLGLTLIGDGTRRVLDGLETMDKERKNDPNYVPSPGPLGVSF